MRILVISDSHGEDSRVKSLLVMYAGTVQAVLHLGDHDRDLLKYQNETDLLMLAVAGNCDDTMLSPRERLVTLGGQGVFMAHGHTFGVNFCTLRLTYRAREQGAAVCLYGHTHRAKVYNEDGILFMNPGSVTAPRGGEAPSYGLLKIDDETGAVSGEIIRL
jgi:hypothetical protein